MLPPLPRRSDCVRICSIPQPYQSSPIQYSGRPAHHPFRGLLGVHSRCGLHTRAALRTDIETWRGREFTPNELRGFQLKSVLGEWALISVVNAMDQAGQDCTGIAAIMPVPPEVKQAGLPAGHNELKFFYCAAPDIELFESFSESLKAKIRKSPEWQLYISDRPTESE